MDFNRRVNYHQERLGTWPINCRETFTNAEQIFATLFEAAVREDEFIKNIFTAAENDKSMRAQICRVPHLSSLNQLDVVNHAASRNPSESDLPLTAERTPQPNDDANHPTEVMLYVNYYGNSKAKQVFRRGSSVRVFFTEAAWEANEHADMTGWCWILCQLHLTLMSQYTAEYANACLSHPLSSKPHLRISYRMCSTNHHVFKRGSVGYV